jgi:hypothetical protein
MYLGILGAYVADVHTLLKRRPLYIVAEEANPKPAVARAVASSIAPPSGR